MSSVEQGEFANWESAYASGTRAGQRGAYH